MAVQPGDDLAQARCPGQLAIKQRHQLALRGQPANPRIRPVHRHQPVKLGPRQMLQNSMKDAIMMAHGVDPPSRVRIVGETSRTEWSQCHAPCPAKLNRTAVGLSRPSTAPSFPREAAHPVVPARPEAGVSRHPLLPLRSTILVARGCPESTASGSSAARPGMQISAPRSCHAGLSGQRRPGSEEERRGSPRQAPAMSDEGKRLALARDRYSRRPDSRGTSPGMTTCNAVDQTGRTSAWRLRPALSFSDPVRAEIGEPDDAGLVLDDRVVDAARRRRGSAAAPRRWRRRARRG